MTIRHFKIFCTVCEEMNMTAAAKRLFITQPSVSQAIAELEDYYGVKLFERLSKKLYITNMGEKLLAYSYQMLKFNEEIEVNMRKKIKPTLRLGSTVTIGTYVTPKYLRNYYKIHNELDIISIIENTHKIENDLVLSKLDCAIVEGDIINSELRVFPIKEDEMVFICAKNSKLIQNIIGDNKEILLEDLIKIPFFIREEESGSYRQFSTLLEDKHLKYKVKGISNTIEGIVNAVAEDLGIGVVSKLVLDYDDRIEAIDVKDVCIKRQFKVVYHKDKHIGEEFKNFLEVLNVKR